MDVIYLSLLGGLLALDGTSLGQFMVSRPVVAGVLTGWAVGDPAAGLLIGGLLEVYFISIFPVGGSEFPEGGPPTVAAVATGVAASGPGGVALGVALGLLLSRVGAGSSQLLRKHNGRLAPDASRETVTVAGVIGGHLAALALDFGRGCLVAALGLVVGGGLAQAAAGLWPLELPGTVTLLAIGACIPAGALVGSLGGWRRRGLLLGAGVAGFLLAGLVL